MPCDLAWPAKFHCLSWAINHQFFSRCGWRKNCYPPLLKLFVIEPTLQWLKSRMNYWLSSKLLKLEDWTYDTPEDYLLSPPLSQFVARYHFFQRCYEECCLCWIVYLPIAQILLLKTLPISHSSDLCKNIVFS